MQTAAALDDGDTIHKALIPLIPDMKTLPSTPSDVMHVP